MASKAEWREGVDIQSSAPMFMVSDMKDIKLRLLAEATDDATILQNFKVAHERLVDNPPWLYIVHDLNPRAFSKNVQGFVPAQSWFVDLTNVSLK